MKVRGSVLEARVRYMKEQGTPAFARFLVALSPEGRALAEGALQPEAWYPLERFVEQLEVIDAQLGDGDLALCEALGRYACDTNLNTFNRFFLKWVNIHQMLDRATNAWSVHYEGVDLSVVERTDHSVSIEIGQHDRPHRGVCLSVKGWIVRMAEHTGTQLVCDEDLCCALGDDVCRMAFSW